MDKYKFVVTLTVEVEAFDESDAKVVVGDYLNPGPLDDIIVIKTIKIK